MLFMLPGWNYARNYASIRGKSLAGIEIVTHGIVCVDYTARAQLAPVSMAAAASLSPWECIDTRALQ